MATVNILQQQHGEEEVEQHSTESAQFLHHEKWLLKQTGLTTRQDLSKLTKLDLPNCRLTSLPEQLPAILPNLEILFCPKNSFQEVPAIIGQCPKLRMVSFKECYTIRSIHAEALQPQLQWLILTGNKLQELPETIGRCTKMQKLMLSGNELKSLPSSMVNMQNLELIRLACNHLAEPPLELLQSCKNLRWAAFASNPFLNNLSAPFSQQSLPLLDDPALEDTAAEVLGQGAGGITRKIVYQNKLVAVKTFVGELTSDGSPQDEKAISVAAASLQDDALIQLLGETKESGALVMEFLENYQALAGPPSFVTCSRDVYDANTVSQLSPAFGWKIVMDMLRVLAKLHQLGICHADFYAHNILISMEEQKVKLSDFGAAFVYDERSDYGKAMAGIELRAYTVLVQELYDLLIKENDAAVVKASEWERLLEECQKPDASFAVLARQFTM
jgi:hypothetical protein